MLIFRNLKVYDSLDTLKIITFWKINQTGNIYLLDKNFFEGKLYTNKEVIYIQELWLRLQDEYYKLQNDPKQRAKLRTSKERMLLMFKTQTIIHHLGFYERFFKYSELLDTKKFLEQEAELFNIFTQLGLNKKINPLALPQEKLKIVQKYTEAVIARLKRLQNEVEEDSKEEIQNIYDAVPPVEQALGRSIGDINNIVASLWIAYINEAKKIQESQKRANNGKK